MARKAKKKKKAIKKKRPIRKSINSTTVQVSKDYFIVIDKTPKVRPGSSRVFGGQRVFWCNLSKHTIEVDFAHNDVLGPSFTLQIDPGEMDNAPGDANGDKKGRTFGYTVTDLVTNKAVPGNSAPDIIIEG